MIVFILAFIVFALCILGLSLSLIYGRGPIKGSCGATENLRGFDTGDSCSGACGAKRSDERDHCKHRQACPAHPATRQNLIE